MKHADKVRKQQLLRRPPRARPVRKYKKMRK
jgi:hypothetical protein